MKIVRSLVIKASPEQVFNALTDFAAYSLWNPWIVKIEGHCEEGKEVLVDVLLLGKVRQYVHKIVTVNKPQIFLWCDVGWFTALVDGRRTRELQPHTEGTLFTVTLSVTGSLSFLVRWLFGKSMASGMTAETLALKSYVEKTIGEG